MNRLIAAWAAFIDPEVVSDGRRLRYMRSECKGNMFALLFEGGFRLLNHLERRAIRRALGVKI